MGVCKVSWKTYNKSMLRKKDRIKKTCGLCKRFEKCKTKRDVEKWNFVPECKEAVYKNVKEEAK
jgi:hypothetical protein